MRFNQIYPTFNDQIAQNSRQRSGQGKKITNDLYDVVYKKFATSGNLSITNKQTAISDQKIEISTPKSQKRITVLGDWLKVDMEDDRNNRKTNWYEIKESKTMKNESALTLVKNIMTGKSQAATDLFNSMLHRKISAKIGEMKKVVMADVLKLKK